MIASLTGATAPSRIRSNSISALTNDTSSASNIPDSITVDSVRRELAATEVVPHEVILKLRNAPGARESLLQQYHAQQAEKFDFPDPETEVLRLKLPEEADLAEALVRLREDSRVAYAEPNEISTLASVNRPNDLDPQAWSLNNVGQTGGTKGADINALEAWGVHTGDWSSAPLVAVLDTGVDYTHPDLASNIWKNTAEIPGDGIDNDNNGVIDDLYGYNAYEDNGDPMDVHGHGTHVAGTIGAEGNNGKGLAGVTWKANIMPVRIFDKNGRASSDSIIRGILYAAKMKAVVTNNSWTSVLSHDAVKEAFASSDAIHVAAAGNNNYMTDRRPTYPMGYELPNIISVGATDHNDQRAEFSNYGMKSVDVMAPGKDIYSTAPGGDYQVMSGTSMATPHVTGLVSLIKDAYPQLSNQQVIDRIYYSSDPVDALAEFSGSGGRINAGRAMENDTTPPAAPNDFAAVKASSRQATLGWTATGDDGWCGKGVAYEVYLSSQPITADNLSEVEEMRTGRTADVGTGQRLGFEFHADEHQDRTMYSALRLVDNVGNRSPLKTTSIVLPKAALHFGESLKPVWNAEGTWQPVEVEGREGVWASNALGENYADNLNACLTSPVIDLSGVKNTQLTYECNYELKPSDTVFVEVTGDGGETWNSVRAMSARSGNEWLFKEVDLSKYDGSRIQVRFRLKTDGKDGAPGVMIDNVRVVSD